MNETPVGSEKTTGKGQTKLKEPAYVAATLRWCNERRKERKRRPLMKLPKGFQFDGDSCPCGKATGLNVGARIYWERLSFDDAGKPIPQSVQKFVRAFDAGRFPQYEAKP